MSEQQLQTYLPFHQKEFWEDFYTKKCTKGETINWYFDITKLDIPEFSLKNLSQQDEILIIGPGTSSIVDYLFENGFEGVTLVDFSEAVMNNIKLKYKERDSWGLETINILNVDKTIYKDVFSVVIDKGCIDCMLSDPKNAEENFIEAMNIVKDSLTQEGVFYYFSYGKLEERVNLLFKVQGIKYRVAVIDMNNNGNEINKEFNASDNIYYLYIITRS